MNIALEQMDRHMLPQALTHQKRMYKELIENAAMGIFQSTHDGTYLTVNPALARLYGYDDPQDMLGSLTDIGNQLYVEPGTRDRFLAVLHDKGRIEHFESQIRRRDGSIIWIAEDARAVRDEDGSFLYFEGFVREITWRKESELQLYHYNEDLRVAVAKRTAQLEAEIEAHKKTEQALAAASKAKSDFISTMSHELRTPLNAIIGFTQLSLSLHDKDSTAYDYSQQVCFAGKHLLNLINELLDLSRIESGKTEVVFEDIHIEDILSSCRTLLDNQAKMNSITIDFNGAESSLWVRGDYTRFKQVILNLLSNAVKYNKPGGTVRVDTIHSDEAVRLCVRDTGHGIPPERSAEVFEPFSRLGQDVLTEGTGIGLSISKEMIELMDGQIGFESTLNVGSTFWVELPCACERSRT